MTPQAFFSVLLSYEISISLCKSRVLILLYMHISLLVSFAFFPIFTTIKHIDSFFNALYILYKLLQLDNITDVYVFTTKYLCLDCKTLKYTFLYITLFIAPTLPSYGTPKYTFIFITLSIILILPRLQNL